MSHQWRSSATISQWLLAIGGVIVALLACRLSGWSERSIRLAGLGLQLAGIGTVVWGISKTRATFGHPSFAASTKACLRRLLLAVRKRNTIVTPDVASASSSVSDPWIHREEVPGPDATVQERLGVLERNLAFVRERISDTQKAMDHELAKTTASLKNAELARQIGDEATRKLLETTELGGVHISAIGALLLFIGVFLSTAAIEISDWLK